MEEKAVKEKQAATATTPKISGAEAVIRSLLHENTEQIFGYPGGSNMPIYDALYDYLDKIDHLLVRHEQGAAHAAEGYAKATGKPAVVFTTSGPGATNLITGIANANIDSVPMICITGQVKSGTLGSDAFQETDVMNITSPITKWNYQITEAAEIPEVIAKAFHIATTGRKGPVVIDITKDAQMNNVAFTYKPYKKLRTYHPEKAISPQQVEKAAYLISQARRPLALIGHGVMLGEAEEELKSFLEKTGIPAASTLLGLSALPSDHPNYVGYLGMHGNYAPNKLTNEADLLVAIGMRFDDRVTGDLSRYATHAKVVHLEIDPAEVNKNVTADAPVLGNVKKSLPILTAHSPANSFPEWRKEFDRYNAQEIDALMQNISPKDGKLTMAEVVSRLMQKEDDALMVTDVGQHQMTVSRYSRFKRSHSLITSGGLGTMGFGLPAAIGAKKGRPDREVIVVSGDGGFQMNIQELGTIMQSDIPVKIIVMNNSYLGMVRQWQQMFNNRRYSFTSMHNPEFTEVAAAYGIASRKVEKREDLAQGLDEMLASEKAFLLEVVVEKEDNVFPMVPPGASVSEMILEV